MRLSAEEFADLVDEALAEIPPGFRHYLDNVVVDVEDLPDRRTLRSVGLDDRRDLLGLYHGTPLTERSFEHPPEVPDRVVLYKRNIDAMCRTRREVVEQIRTTVLHEVGHHFGMGEEELDELGYG